MIPNRFGREWAIITIVCVIAISLFPVAVGSYTAMHGPVSALLALRASIVLQLTIVLAGLSLFDLVFRLFLSFSPASLVRSVLFSPNPPICSSLLRC